jgi:hypothetical protein
MGSAHRRVGRKPFGLSAFEIIAALVTLAFFSAAMFYYLTTLGPEQNRLQNIESKLDALEADIIKVRAERDAPPPQNTSQEALDSLEAFKLKFLKPTSEGEIALYRDINALAAKHRAQLTSGIDMKRETGKQAGDQKKSKSKKDPLSEVYPQTVIRFTVEGQYAGLRTFLNELESNKQFIVINTVSLTEVEQSEGGERRGRSRSAASSGVSLSVEMTAYFKP